MAAVSRRFDVDLERRGALLLLKKRRRSRQDAATGDLHSLGSSLSLSSALARGNPDGAGQVSAEGRPSAPWEERRGGRRRVVHRGHAEGPWQLCSEEGEAVGPGAGRGPRG